MNKLEEIIEYESESHLVDFKLFPYDLSNKNKKHEFLKDISSMANNPSNEDKYIIIGVKEKEGIASSFQNVDEIDDQAKYQQYLDSNIEPPINFEYRLFNYKEFKLTYFRIYGNIDRPYLFKKNVNLPDQDSPIKYRNGDGLIRVGTSTRRLVRSDLDKIYESKFNEVDRKSDLNVIVVIDKAEDDINITDKNYFDLCIENKSSKSIGFDIEMKIFFDDIPTVRSKDSIKESIIIPKPGSRFGVQTFYNPQIPNFDLSIEEEENYLYIRRTKRINEEYAVRISQNSKKDNVFFKELILNARDNFTLKAEVIIRSDDFKDGPLKINIEEEIKST
jgi:hypothetical protein